MYETLTKLIDAMETDTYGEIITDTGGKGTPDEIKAAGYSANIQNTLL